MFFIWEYLRVWEYVLSTIIELKSKSLKILRQKSVAGAVSRAEFRHDYNGVSRRECWQRSSLCART